MKSEEYNKGFIDGYKVGYSAGYNKETHPFFIIFKEYVMCDVEGKVLFFDEYNLAENMAKLLHSTKGVMRIDNRTGHINYEYNSIFDDGYRIACTISEDYKAFKLFDIYNNKEL